MHGWKLAEVSELKVNDQIRIVCDEILQIFRVDKNHVDGHVISIFDATGKQGPWWQIEVRLHHNKWWMYEPQRYKGQIFKKDLLGAEWL